jgi:hypothetical protein
MSYERFLAAIEDASLLAVAEHWNSARGGRQMPAWKDIDPAAIGQYLPIIWAWRYEKPLQTFVGRLAGEEIIAVLGNSIRGRPIEECFPAGAHEMVRARYMTVIDGPELMHSYGTVFRHAGGEGRGERIVLPLAEDGVHGDGVIGATVYRLGIRPTLGDQLSVVHHGEIVDFFPLA